MSMKVSHGTSHMGATQDQVDFGIAAALPILPRLSVLQLTDYSQGLHGIDTPGEMHRKGQKLICLVLVQVSHSRMMMWS